MTQVAKDAVRISLDVPEDMSETLRAQFQALPGQYLPINIEIKGKSERRTYTVCSVKGEFPLQLIIRKISEGIVSHFITALNIGDIILAAPPMGRFAHHQADIAGNYLLLAAGIGITPIYPIAHAILNDDSESKVTLIYGNRDYERMVLSEALLDLKNSHLGRFQMINLFSQQKQDVDLLSNQLNGQVFEQMVQSGLLAFPFDKAYLCLPGATRDEAVTLLQQESIDKKNIISERFVPTNILEKTAEKKKIAKIGDVALQITHDGVTHQLIVEDNDATILQVAQKNQLQLPFSCAAGMCATCRCKIVQGEVTMQQNYSLEDWELEAGYVLACQSIAVSKTVSVDFDAV